MKFKDLYKLNLGTYAHKNWTKCQQFLMTLNYNTCGDSIFNPPFQCLTLTQCQLVEHQAPKLWNSIPATVRNWPSLRSFKWNYWKHLISQFAVLDFISDSSKFCYSSFLISFLLLIRINICIFFSFVRHCCE